jgi:hypothetical protein
LAKVDKAPIYEVYQRVPGLVLGFHGCDEDVGEALLCGKTQQLNKSANAYDWLGGGIYFWENDPQRAWEFAKEGIANKHQTKGVIKKPFVVGAVIDLGLCLNLLDRKGLDEVTQSFDILEMINEILDDPMPENKGKDMAARFLDCAVIEALHQSRTHLNREKKNAGRYLPYDTVRAAYPEDEPLYTNAGFRKKNHVQIAVRSLSCIKGYFRPIEAA